MLAAPSAGWPKLKATDFNRLMDEIKKGADYLPAFRQRIYSNPKYLIGDGEYNPSVVHAGTRKNALHIAAEQLRFLISWKIQVIRKLSKINFSSRGNTEVLKELISIISDKQCTYLKRMFADWDSLTPESKVRILEIFANFNLLIIFSTSLNFKATHRSLLLHHYLNNTDAKTLRTPLWYAVDKMHPACVRELLASGADPSIVDRWSYLYYIRFIYLEHSSARAWRRCSTRERNYPTIAKRATRSVLRCCKSASPSSAATTPLSLSTDTTYPSTGPYAHFYIF